MNTLTKTKIASSWDISANEYDNQYAHGLKSKEEATAWKNALGNLTGNTRNNILDVGTGTGFLAIMLAELGNNVKGVDISEGMMCVAKKKAKEKGLPVHFSYGDAENLDEPDNTYDLVINRHLLWTLPHPEEAISEWIRVLKPGGKLIIIDGNWFYNKASNSISVFLGRLLIAITEFRNPWKHSSGYDKELQESLPMMKDENARNIVPLIQKSGLKNIKVSGLRGVEKEEKKAMPFKQKLLNPYKRIIIEGIKP